MGGGGSNQALNFLRYYNVIIYNLLMRFGRGSNQDFDFLRSSKVINHNEYMKLRDGSGALNKTYIFYILLRL